MLVFPKSMVNFNNETYHSPIVFLSTEYLGFLKLQVRYRFTGMDTCISPIPINRNWVISIVTFGDSHRRVKYV